MFSDLLESTILKKKTAKRWSVILCAVFQTAILGVLILVPLIYSQALPQALFPAMLIAPRPPRPAAPHQNVKAVVKTVPRLMPNGVLVDPSRIPKGVLKFKEELPPDVDTTSQSSIFTDIPGQGIIGSNGPAIPQAPRVALPERVKQGGLVTEASLISQTRPVYPALAVQTRTQGTVTLHAIIDKDGKVAQLEVISGHPLLVQAALDAVKQWRYGPTLLNNVPVEVNTTITVTFTLGG